MNTKSSSIEIAKKTIIAEINTLNGILEAITATFDEAVQAIFHSHGRVIVTGMGKSASIAQKIVGTFNSTGTAAIFMHAADAAHGDLGIIRDQDIVLCLSKSGETEELKVIIPQVKSRGNTCIAFVSNAKSYLAIQADITIHIPVEAEADPNYLAPTSSTTAQLVMGDALAIALLSLRGFTSEEFASIHPGGNLGKKLYLRVADLITENNYPKIKKEATLSEIIFSISSGRLGATAVIVDKGTLQGIITDGDLRRMLEKQHNVSTLSAEMIMTRNPRTISSQEKAVKALQVMKENSITQLLILDDNGVYCGIIHLHDLLKEGLV